ncbi:MAG TPA: ABC transporter ATP-binding protein [Candidatus Binatia bacterium]|nr:ABC transporter ATP-binding protein [Candidatus Binatia bacterium]
MAGGAAWRQDKNSEAVTVIRIRSLQKVFPSNRGQVWAVKEIDLDVGGGEFVVLLGPSGCGKTTTLRCVAGLEQPDQGTIEIAGQIVDSVTEGIYVSPERRNIGMVFQSYAVWPHLTVYDNIVLPLTEGRYRISKSQVRGRVLEVLKLVRLEDLESRPVTDLSGGQQQRVALARAIVTRPKVLLMDEPLSNLDARLRDQMRFELKKITKTVGVTTLYVTHDQAEALSLGDRVCVMHEGKILQVGPAQEVYARPANLFVAEFVGEMNFIKGKVVGPRETDSILGRLHCSVPPNCQSGSHVTLAIRPEHLTLSRDALATNPAVRGKVISINYVGDATLFEVEVGGVALRVKQPGAPGLAVGDFATIALPPDGWQIYPSLISPASPP